VVVEKADHDRTVHTAKLNAGALFVTDQRVQLDPIPETYPIKET
jgi:hypothetical protein